MCRRTRQALLLWTSIFFRDFFSSSRQEFPGERLLGCNVVVQTGRPRNEAARWSAGQTRLRMPSPHGCARSRVVRRGRCKGCRSKQTRRQAPAVFEERRRFIGLEDVKRFGGSCPAALVGTVRGLLTGFSRPMTPTERFPDSALAQASRGSVYARRRTAHFVCNLLAEGGIRTLGSSNEDAACVDQIPEPAGGRSGQTRRSLAILVPRTIRIGLRNALLLVPFIPRSITRPLHRHREQVEAIRTRCVRPAPAYFPEFQRRPVTGRPARDADEMPSPPITTPTRRSPGPMLAVVSGVGGLYASARGLAGAGGGDRRWPSASAGPLAGPRRSPSAN